MKIAQRLQAAADLAWAGRHEQAIAAATAALRLKMLDADERMTAALAGEVTALEEAQGTVAYNAAPLFFLDGQPIPRASGFPTAVSSVSVGAGDAARAGSARLMRPVSA